MKYTFLDSVTYQSSPEDMGCWRLSWGADTTVQSQYPRLPCVINGDTLSVEEAKKLVNPDHAYLRSTKPMPHGWVFSPLEIQKWEW